MLGTQSRVSVYIIYVRTHTSIDSCVRTWDGPNIIHVAMGRKMSKGACAIICVAMIVVFTDESLFSPDYYILMSVPNIASIHARECVLHAA